MVTGLGCTWACFGFRPRYTPGMDWIAKAPEFVPVLVLREVNLFPAAFLPVSVRAGDQVRLFRDVLTGNRLFAVAMRRPRCKTDRPERVACLAIPRLAVQAGSTTIRAILQGLVRVELQECLARRPYPVYAIRVLQEPPFDRKVVQGLIRRLQKLVRENLGRGFITPYMPIHLNEDSGSGGTELSPMPQEIQDQFMSMLEDITEPNQVVDLLSCLMLHRAAHRQRLLGTLDLETRLELLIKFLNAEIRANRKKGTQSNAT